MNTIAIVLTVPFTLNAFVRPHLERLAQDYDITVFLNMEASEIRPVVPPQVRLVQLGIARRVALWADLKTLIELTGIFRRGKYELIISMTPKGGLLAMVAGWLAAVPERVHCFTGQVWATRRGGVRALLKTMDRVTACCATRLLADSGSQKQFLINEGVVEQEKIEVLANGSMAGVDAGRFRPDAAARSRIRAQLGIAEDACCLLFVGRLAREKGVADLLAAFEQLGQRHPDLHLLLVGPDEDGHDEVVRNAPRIHRVGYTEVVEEYMAAADVFCLPSHREGFGLVLIEAGAMGLPVVASRIYGVTDAVVDGDSGLLHRPEDVADLTEKIEVLVRDVPLRGRLGEAGRRRAVEMFNVELVTTALEGFLQRLAGRRP